MAILAFEGFDHYTFATAGEKLFDGAATGSMGTGRLGTGQAIKMFSTSDVKVAHSATAQGVWCFGVKFDVLPGSDSVFFKLIESGTTHVDLRVTASGTIRITRDGTSLAVSSATVGAGTWYWCELKANIHDSTGAAEVRMNSTSYASVTGADTKNGGSGTIDTVAFVGPNSFDNNWFDDFYVDDGSSFLGEKKVSTLYPSGAGNSAQFTPSAGNNYECVDEAQGDGDTTYVESSTGGHIDLHAFGNLSGSISAVNAVKVVGYARKDDGATREIQLGVRHSGTNSWGSTVALSSSYQFISRMMLTNPVTAVAWTEADVTGAEFGVQNI
jgi:hypothetical protein